MRTGRNEPCPCGSGKKYKKCCLEHDSKISDAVMPQLEEWEPEDEDWDDDSEIEEYDDFDEDSDEEYDDFDEEEDDDDDDDLDEENDDEDEDSDEENELDVLTKEIDNYEDEEGLSEISEAEKRLVDEWWDVYKEMPHDTEKEREYLVAFMEKYPHLTDHLHLYHEVLFELGSHHYKQGIYEIFVELLLRIRKEYPFTYKKSFSYYDSDLIYWYVAQGRFDEIDEFFSLFREADTMDEKFYTLHKFFRALNRSDIIVKSFADSKNREYVLSDIVYNIIMRYIDKPVSDETMQTLSDEIKLVWADNADSYGKEGLKRFLTNFQRPFTEWDADLPQKRSQAFSFFCNVTDNFSAFIYKKTDLSFNSALLYSEIVYDYFRRIISEKKFRPANTFMLDKDSIFNYSVKYNSNWLLWGYNIGCFIELNALYYFAAYLKACGNITDDRQGEIQKTIAEIYQKVYDASKTEGPEMLSFEMFPLWEIRE